MDKKHLSDKEIIDGCIIGKAAYQELLYSRYASKMFAICRRYFPNDQMTAEDVLQDGFIKIFQNISRFRHEGSFEGWLKRIFVNTAIEYYRKSVQMYPIIDNISVSTESFDPNIIETLNAENLLEMIATLSPGYRTVFNLYAIEGYTHKEIAELLGVNEGTSKSQLARARQILQKMVQKNFNYNQEANYV